MEEFYGVGTYDQHIIGYLELMRNAYTGCNPTGLMLTHDKGLSKEDLTEYKKTLEESSDGQFINDIERKLDETREIAIGVLPLDSQVVHSQCAPRNGMSSHSHDYLLDLTISSRKVQYRPLHSSMRICW